MFIKLFFIGLNSLLKGCIVYLAVTKIIIFISADYFVFYPNLISRIIKLFLTFNFRLHLFFIYQYVITIYPYLNRFKDAQYNKLQIQHSYHNRLKISTTKKGKTNIKFKK